MKLSILYNNNDTFIPNCLKSTVTVVLSLLSQEGYGVVVLNTNFNHVVISGRRISIPVSGAVT